MSRKKIWIAVCALSLSAALAANDALAASAPLPKATQDDLK
jgi:hypothetical protein